MYFYSILLMYLRIVKNLNLNLKTIYKAPVSGAESEALIKLCDNDVVNHFVRLRLLLLSCRSW